MTRVEIAHYSTGEIECIDYIFDKLGYEGGRDFILANILKYGSRAKYKGQFDADIEKIRNYAVILQEKTAQHKEALAKEIMSAPDEEDAPDESRKISQPDPRPWPRTLWLVRRELMEHSKLLSIHDEGFKHLTMPYWVQSWVVGPNTLKDACKIHWGRTFNEYYSAADVLEEVRLGDTFIRIPKEEWPLYFWYRDIAMDSK